MKFNLEKRNYVEKNSPGLVIVKRFICPLIEVEGIRRGCWEDTISSLALEGVRTKVAYPCVPDNKIEPVCCWREVVLPMFKRLLFSVADFNKCLTNVCEFCVFRQQHLSPIFFLGGCHCQ